MKKYVKCYHVFLAEDLFLVILYLVYPLLVGGFCGFLAVPAGMGGMIKLALLITAQMIVSVELFLDTWVYGGILAKDTHKLEFLKTSHRGMQVLKNSVRMDKLRRGLSTTLLLAVVQVAGGRQADFFSILGLIFATCAVMEAALVLARHIQGVSLVMLVVVVAGMLTTATGLLALGGNGLQMVLFAFLFVAVVLLSNKYMYKRAEESYYDR